MLSDLIHKVAAEEGKEKENSTYKPRPSVADPNKCIRQLDYFRQGYKKKPLPGRTFIIFDDGNWHEELTIQWIQKTAFRIHSQQMKIKSHGISGSIDGIVTDLLNIDRLFEHKAINHFTFERFWKGELPLGYFVQMAFYLDGVRQDNPDISEGILLIKNKNTGQYLEYIVHYDDDCLVCTSRTHSAEGETIPMFVYMPGMLSYAIARFAEIEQYAQEHRLHDRPFFLGDDWQCDYCQYSGICWDGYKAEVDRRTEKGALDAEANVLCIKKHRAAQEKKRFEEMEEEAKHGIKTWLQRHEYKKAVGDDFIVSLSVTERNGKQSETLRVTQITKKGE